jgi:hypothetical protein
MLSAASTTRAAIDRETALLVPRHSFGASATRTSPTATASTCATGGSPGGAM